MKFSADEWSLKRQILVDSVARGPGLFHKSQRRITPMICRIALSSRMVEFTRVQHSDPGRANPCWDTRPDVLR